MKTTPVIIALLGAFVFYQKTNCQPLNFDYTLNSSCPPFQVTFDVQSAPANTDYFKWDFYDGSGFQTTYNWSINHTFTSGGTFPTLLTAHDSLGNQISFYSLLVYIDGPGVNFTTLSACPGDNVYFLASDYPDNNMTIIQWDFGDGTVLADNQWGPAHAFDSAGTYIISITVNDPECGNVTVYREFTISSSYNLTSGGIEFNPDSVCPGDEAGIIIFGANGTFEWDFGDGTYGTTDLPSTSHEYDAAGIYYVACQVTNGCASTVNFFDTLIVSNNILIDISNFYSPEIMPSPACPGDPVSFNCWDCTMFAEYYWDFGDGTYDTNNTSVIHSFSSIGTKFPELTLVNGCGSDTSINYPLSIQSNLPLDINNFQALFFPDSACPGDNVFALASNGAANYVWDFDDGTIDSTPDFNDDVVVFIHPYSSAQTYYPQLTVTNGCGSSDSLTVPVFIGANVDVQTVDMGDGPMAFAFVSDNNGSYYPRCSPIEMVAFSGSSFSWDFGDGNTLTTNSNFVTHAWDSVGYYTVTVSITNSCGNSATFSQEIYIDGPCSYSCPFSVNVSTVNATCGNSDGSATAIAGGGVSPYTYNWSNGSTGSSATGLPADFYTVGVVDSLGCVTYSGADVSNGDITINVTTTDVLCKGGNNGSIDVTVSGGSPPYTFEWSDGNTAEDISGLPAGIYNLIVYDSGTPDKCIATESIAIDEPLQLNVYVLTNAANCMNTDGNAMVLATGGTAPYSYLWSTGGTDESAVNLAPGNYSITVTDASGCIDIRIFAIGSIDGPSATIGSITNVSCASPNTGSVALNVSGGVPPYLFTWSTGETTQNISILVSGNYYVTVTDDSGCVAALTATVGIDPPANPGICMVTVDSATGKNLVVWQDAAGAVSYNIYKEGSISNVYNKVGSVADTSLSEYADVTADPLIRSWRYKISSVDACGNESPLSGAHKTMHLTTNLGINNEVNLIWDGYEGFSFGTYRIYRGTTLLNLALIDSVPSNIFTYTDNNHPGGLLIYVVEAKRVTPCTAAKVKKYNSSKSNTASQTAPVGIAEKTDGLNGNTTIYPNPASAIFTVESTDRTPVGRVSVINCLGQKLLIADGRNDRDFVSKLTVDMSSFSEGIYILKVEKTTETNYFRVVVQR